MKRIMKLNLGWLALLGLWIGALPAGADPGRRDGLAAALVRPEGARFVPWQWTSEPEVVALYFGSGRCTPCRAFEPRLRETYARLRAAGADTEVVFVSLDESELEMRRHMQRLSMPWPALARHRLPSLPAVRALAGKGTPNLVLVDRAGRVLASAWQGGAYAGADSVLEAWLACFRPGPAGIPPLHAENGGY